MKILMMRFDAPLMSFGAPIVGAKGVIQPYPSLALMTGLLANAMGYDHADFEDLEYLQQNLSYAAREDVRGSVITDWQTVDLGQDFMLDACAWSTNPLTTGGRAGASGVGTHIRERDYWAGRKMTVSVHVMDASLMSQAILALQKPKRPLFIGRKPCIPSGPIYLDTIEADGPLHALQVYPLHKDADKTTVKIWHEVRASERDLAATRIVTDRREWRNGIHVGQRFVKETRHTFGLEGVL